MTKNIYKYLQSAKLRAAQRHLGPEKKFDLESLMFFISCSGLVHWEEGQTLKFKVQGTTKSCILGEFLMYL